jgi:hypothetical protein
MCLNTDLFDPEGDNNRLPARSDAGKKGRAINAIMQMTDSALIDLGSKVSIAPIYQEELSSGRRTSLTCLDLERGGGWRVMPA